MNTLEEPPPKRGMGCFAKGCLILIVLAILLAVVGVGGTYWSVRHVYLSDKPVQIPQTSSPTETEAVTPGGTSAAASSGKSVEVRERLDTMKQSARAHEKTEVELTASDINALIAANRKSRGTASVAVDGADAIEHAPCDEAVRGDRVAADGERDEHTIGSVVELWQLFAEHFTNGRTLSSPYR